MATKQQKNQMKLAFPAEDRGEAPKAAGGGTEASLTSHVYERPASSGSRYFWRQCDSLTIRTAGYGPVRPVV